MDKYESLITAVVFQYSGVYAYNRQQLCEFTTKDLESEFTLRVGESFKHENVEYQITNIQFSIENEWLYDQKEIKVFTNNDNNPTNCKVVVFIEKNE